MMTPFYITTLNEQEKELYRQYVKQTGKARETTTDQPGRVKFNFDSVGHLIYWLLDRSYWHLDRQGELAEGEATNIADYYGIENAWLDMAGKICFSIYDNWQTPYGMSLAEFENWPFEVRGDLR